MTRRQYSNTATEATLTGGIGAADSSFTLTSFSGYPAVPFTATISRGEADEEVVLVTAVSVSTITATRGYDGTTAKSHAAGASFVHTTVAKDFDEANVHVNATTGVHGVAGSIVGTTDVQVLTNKTLTTPTLAAPTVTGTASMGSVTLSGTLSVTSASSTLSSLSAGSVAVSGTLSVTGASTLTGAVTAAGALTASGGIVVPAGKKIALTDAPTAGTDGVNKTYADALGTAAATVSTIARRDAAGRLAVATPAATGDAATKGYVDSADTALDARLDVVEAAALPSTPVEVSYAANWANYTDASVPWNGVTYTKVNGVVTVTGALRTTAAVTGLSTAFTLPVGFRPAGTVKAIADSANPNGFLIRPTGVVVTVSAMGSAIATSFTATYVAA